MTTRILTICSAVAVAAGVAACRPQATLPEAETPTLDVTDWTDKTELFMEYPPLVAAKTALFAVHLTKMGDFKPVSEGRAQVEFTPEAGGPAKVLLGPKPTRPG